MTRCASIFLVLLAACAPLRAQEVKVVHDNECGCDLVFVDGIETTRSGGLYGFRREDGTVIAPNRYRYVDRFAGGYCRVMLDLGQCGLIDSTGREVVPCLYDEVDLPSEGRVRVTRGGLSGYTDLDGQVVIGLQYASAGPFSEGFAAVAIPEHGGLRHTYIDPDGHQPFSLRFDQVRPFICGLAPVRQQGLWGMLGRDGQMQLPAAYERLTDPFDSLFLAGDADGMALFDTRMERLTPFVYSWTGGISDGRILVVREGRYGFLDRKGREVVPCQWDEAGLFRLGRAMVRRADRYGIIDTVGRLVLPVEYENTLPHGEKYIYSDGLALVEQGGLCGFVDLQGRQAIPLLFEEAFDFSEGLAAVKHGGRWGYIDTRGEVFMPFVFDLASPYRHGRAEVVYNGIVRMADRRGRCVKNCQDIIAWRNWNE